MRRLLLSSFLLLTVIACATASRFNDLRPGMTKAEVVKIMGEPDSRSFIEGAEYFHYFLSRSGYEAYASKGLAKDEYVVRFVSERMDSYGKSDHIMPKRFKVERD